MNSYILSRIWFDWAFENPSKISPNHSALYFFCIEHCNRLGWKKEFGLPTTMAKEAIGIRSYNTYINTLNDLVAWGFIKMIEKSKNQYSSNIIALSKNDKALNKALDKALIKHLIKQGESTEQSIDSIDKPIKQKTSETINNESNDSQQNEILPIEEKVDKFEELKKLSLDQIYEQYKSKPTDPILNVCMWNHFAEKHKKPKISKITNGRKKLLKLRFKNKDFILSKILSEVKNQKFAMDGDWFTFDWIIENDENYVRVLEGKYNTKEKEEIKKGNFEI